MDKFDLDFTRPPADFLEPLSASDMSRGDTKGKLIRKSHELRTRIRARRAAQKIAQIAVDQQELAELQKNIHRWGWYPAIRHAFKRGVPIEVAIAANAIKKAT